MAIVRGTQTLTARQQKQQVLKWTGWTANRYEKEYDKLRNRVRNYERANGLERGSINAADLLAREARTRHYAPRYGEKPQSTTLYQAVMQTTSASTGAELSERQIQRSRTAAFLGLQRRYAGLISVATQTQIKELQDIAATGNAAAYEKYIIGIGKDYNAYKTAYTQYRNKLLEQGIIIPKFPDSL